MTLRDLIESRCLDLGIGRGEFLRRAGFASVLKALLPTDGTEEELEIHPVPSVLVERIAQGLGLPVETVVDAIAESRTKLETANWAVFKPHAVVLLWRHGTPAADSASCPLRTQIRFIEGSHPDSYLGQALANLPQHTCASTLAAVLINYGPNQVVFYDSLGYELERLNPLTHE